jgi:hypothetical protein
MEEIKDSIVSSCVVLLKDHKVKQKQIFQWIREGLTCYVDTLPKVKVLYNACHGGFGLSAEFMEFVSKVDVEPCVKDESHDWEYEYKNTRVFAADYIIPYGVHVLQDENNKGIFDMLYLYEYYSLGNIIASVYSIQSFENEETFFKINIKSLGEYLTSSNAVFGKLEDEYYTKPSLYCLMYSRPDFENYTKADLQELYDKYKHNESGNVNAEKIRKRREEASAIVGEETVDEIYNYIKETTEKLKPSDSWCKYFERETESIRFIQALNTYGYKEKKTWKYQKSFSSRAMDYLLAKQKAYTKAQGQDENDGASDGESELHVYDYVCKHKPLEVNEKAKMNVLRKFGLICASDTYCNLAIAEMPSLLDWEIAEYDGLERVCVV